MSLSPYPAVRNTMAKTGSSKWWIISGRNSLTYDGLVEKHPIQFSGSFFFVIRLPHICVQTMCFPPKGRPDFVLLITNTSFSSSDDSGVAPLNCCRAQTTLGMGFWAMSWFTVRNSYPICAPLMLFSGLYSTPN